MEGEVGELAALVDAIAVSGQVAGTSASVDAARPAISVIEAADVRLDPAWTRLRAGAARSPEILLEPR